MTGLVILSLTIRVQWFIPIHTFPLRHRISWVIAHRFFILADCPGIF
jgi:hypothetical protein